MSDHFRIIDGRLEFRANREFAPPDYTHDLAELPRWAGFFPSETCSVDAVDPEAACYEFENQFIDQYQDMGRIEVERMVACGRPQWFLGVSPNTGSHRVVYYLNLNDQRFAVVVEEEETKTAAYVRDLITLGVENMAEHQSSGNLSFSLDLLSGAIVALTGHEPIFQSYRRECRSSTGDSHNTVPIEQDCRTISRFDFLDVVDLSEIENQECQLSERASQASEIFPILYGLIYSGYSFLDSPGRISSSARYFRFVGHPDETLFFPNLYTTSPFAR
ncbi:MAG: hypothetical protein ABH859_08355 [Pseudomonadota bacterium]